MVPLIFGHLFSISYRSQQGSLDRRQGWEFEPPSHCAFSLCLQLTWADCWIFVLRQFPLPFIWRTSDNNDKKNELVSNLFWLLLKYSLKVLTQHTVFLWPFTTNWEKGCVRERTWRFSHLKLKSLIFVSVWFCCSGCFVSFWQCGDGIQGLIHTCEASKLYTQLNSSCVGACVCVCVQEHIGVHVKAKVKLTRRCLPCFIF